MTIEIVCKNKGNLLGYLHNKNRFYYVWVHLGSIILAMVVQYAGNTRL